MKIGLLGGVFNPPHFGHLLMAQQVLDFSDIEEVWLLPVFRHTFNKNLDSLPQRIEMTKLITTQKIKISTLEAEYKLSGNTVELVPILKKLYPNDDFMFIIGTDQLPTFHKWGNYERLLEDLPFLVVPRAGYPAAPLYKGMMVLEHELLVKSNISSSIVRGRVKHGLAIDYLVPEKVREYIEKHRLYK
jgi:nicotinate-nucleotide adenylyltransferase